MGKDFYKCVIGHKEVNKLTMALGSAVASFKDSVSKALTRFSNYHFLWKDDRDKYIEVRPLLSGKSNHCFAAILGTSSYLNLGIIGPLNMVGGPKCSYMCFQH